MNNFIEKVKEKYSYFFKSCECCGSQIKGHYSAIEFESALQEAYSAGNRDMHPEAILDRRMVDKIKYEARSNALQEAIEIGEELKKNYAGDSNVALSNMTYNQAITDFQKSLKKLKEEK